VVVWVGVGDMVGCSGGDECAVLRRAGSSPSLIPLAGWEKGEEDSRRGFEISGIKRLATSPDQPQ